MQPRRIRINQNSYLIIEWNDKSISSIPLGTLRKLCPCASCNVERENQSDSYIPIYYSDQIRITKINSVGKYAINLVWADGHNTGIYEYSFLKNLSSNTVN